MKKLLLVLFCLSVVQIPAMGQDKPVDKTKLIDKLIEQLGSQGWREREDAHKELEKIGEPALEKLKAALKSDDLEKASRAKTIIKSIQETLKESRIKELAEKARKNLRPEKDSSDIEREIFRRIAETVISVCDSEKSPVIKQRETQEFEKDGANRGKLAGAWTTEDSLTPYNTLSRFRTGYQDVVNHILILSASGSEATPAEKARAVFQVNNPSKDFVLHHLLEYAYSEDEILRLTAIQKLRDAAREEYIPKYIAWLEDAQPAVREFAAQALGNMKIKENIPEALKKAVNDKDYRVRHAAVSAVITVESAAITGLLLPLLKDKSAIVRQVVARGLRKGPLDMVGVALREALGDKNSRVVSAAAGSLGELGDTQSAPKIAALLDTNNRIVANDAIKALTQVALDKYSEKIVKLGSNLGYSWIVADSLEKCGHPLAYGTLEKIIVELDDKQAGDYYKVRIFEAMLKIDVDKTREKIIRIFNSEKTEDNYKMQLIRPMKQCPDKNIIDSFIAHLDSKSPSLPIQVLEALRFLTARDMDSAGWYNIGSDEQKKALKNEWKNWWAKNKEKYSPENAAAERAKKYDELLENMKKLMSEGKYQEVMNFSYIANRLEPTRQDANTLVRKASLLQGIQRELQLRKSGK